MKNFYKCYDRDKWYDIGDRGRRVVSVIGGEGVELVRKGVGLVGF